MRSSEAGRGLVLAPPRDADGVSSWLPALLAEVRAAGGIRHRELAAALREAIADDRIPVGSRLPPQRELARQLAVGRTTIASAYNLLLSESLLRCRQGAGTWVVARPLASGAPLEPTEPGESE